MSASMIGRVRLCVYIFCSISTFLASDVSAKNCKWASFGQSSFVCVCNATWCDPVKPYQKLAKGKFSMYQTSEAADMLLGPNVGSFQHQKIATDSGVTVTVNRSQTYQKIIGFGGAFTDAAAINILSLSPGAQNNLLKAYFSAEGIEYSVGRIPMAGCDFSTHTYSYDDSPMDFELKNFSLAPEDIKMKIPLIHQAQNLRKTPLTLFGSPWSAPAWMKTNGGFKGKGSLIGQPGGKYFKTWAMYFVKFIQEYQKNNLTIWGVTAQNEPTDGEIFKFPFNAMGWTPEMQRDFIAKDLGPALEQNGLGHVKIMILDDNRLWLPAWAKTVLSDPTAEKYVSGIAIHWYLDFIVPASVLSATNEMFPDKFILATEACNGFLPWQPKVLLGDWGRAESYVKDIMEDLQNWVAGWTDWNLALNMSGGPNWVNNDVDSPIIVDSSKDVFYRTPVYYAMGHFSKFIIPGSVRIGLVNWSATGLDIVAFTRPDGGTVLVVANRNSEDASFTLSDPLVGSSIINITRHSIQTYIWYT